MRAKKVFNNEEEFGMILNKQLKEDEEQGEKEEEKEFGGSKFAY